MSSNRIHQALAPQLSFQDLKKHFADLEYGIKNWDDTELIKTKIDKFNETVNLIFVKQRDRYNYTALRENFIGLQFNFGKLIEEITNNKIILYLKKFDSEVLRKIAWTLPDNDVAPQKLAAPESRIQSGTKIPKTKEESISKGQVRQTTNDHTVREESRSSIASARGDDTLENNAAIDHTVSTNVKTSTRARK